MYSSDNNIDISWRTARLISEERDTIINARADIGFQHAATGCVCSTKISTCVTYWVVGTSILFDHNGLRCTDGYLGPLPGERNIADDHTRHEREIIVRHSEEREEEEEKHVWLLITHRHYHLDALGPLLAGELDPRHGEWPLACAIMVPWLAVDDGHVGVVGLRDARVPAART